MAEPPAAHLVSAAAAWQRILTELHPEEQWIVTIVEREPDASDPESRDAA